jgi:hypothetical protein
MAERRIVEAAASMTGVDQFGSKRATARDVEAAMSQAVLDCYRKGIKDPQKIRDAQLQARERVLTASR